MHPRNTSITLEHLPLVKRSLTLHPPSRQLVCYLGRMDLRSIVLPLDLQ